MKLLLTSNGLCNKTISKALLDLLSKPFSKSKLVFIPTAANVETNDKWWLIDDLYNCKKQGFEKIDIVDISALEKEQWLPRLEEADILLFSGGNTFHLMYWLKKSGLAKLLPKLLKTKIYMGISAGSMVAGHAIGLTHAKKLYYPDLKAKYADEKSLGLVNFYFRPHFNSPAFPYVNKDTLTKFAKEHKEPLYAMDDETAVKINGDKIEIVGGGKYLVLNT